MIKTQTFESLRVNTIRGEKISALLICIFFLLFFVSLQSASVYGGDGGDMVSAAFVRGVAHPPGYPLYTFVAWLLTKIPFSTVAWRVTLLSSIPASVTAGIFFLLLKKITKNSLLSLIGTLTLCFSYLFWLYASIPEVFSLHVLFITAIFYLVWDYRENGHVRQLKIAALILGLGLAHHQTIVFLIPAFLFIIWPRLRATYTKRIILQLLLLIGVGLLPYLYVIWAAHGNPLVNWEDPKTVSGFIRLITRAMYGTFRSGNNFGLDQADRFNLLQSSLETFFIDFTKVGILLGVIGMVYQFKKFQQDFYRIFLAFICIGPLFIFYSGFPTVLNFYLGITERFMLAPYLFFVIWITLGIQVCVNLIHLLIIKLIGKSRLYLPITLVFLIIPLTLLYTNFVKITPLRRDLTAEKLGRDVLNSLPDNSLLLLMDDTTFFDTEYVYLTDGGLTKWRGVKLVQLGTIGLPFYTPILNQYLPDLDLTQKVPQQTILSYIAHTYFDKFPIFSNVKIDVGKDFVWIPVGLFNRLYKQSTALKPQDYISENEKIFSEFQDPQSGALSVYTHVTLADVSRVYANARFQVGDILLRTNQVSLAEKYFQQAILLQPDSPFGRLKLAESQLLQNKCTDSEAVLTEQEKLFPYLPDTYKLLAILYQSCYHDESKARENDLLYQNSIKKGQTELRNY
jgi:hypothetical protein